jgi:hypothetical protein
MGINVIPQANINLFFDDLTQAQTMANRITAVSLGYIAIDYDQFNSTLQGGIKSGSKFEANGVLYELTTDYGFYDRSTNNAQNYVYYTGNSVTPFELNANVPTWSPLKNGWYYNGNQRALMKIFKLTTQYNGAVILDSYNAMNIVNHTQRIPSTLLGEGINVFSGSGSKELPAGAYSYHITGGAAGAGGAGGSKGNTLSSATNGNAGTGNGAGSSVIGTFFWDGGTVIVTLGNKGGAGGNGEDAYGFKNGNYTVYGGGGGGGGGGGAGGDTIIAGIAIAKGNMGGNGGAGGKGGANSGASSGYDYGDGGSGGSGRVGGAGGKQGGNGFNGLSGYAIAIGGGAYAPRPGVRGGGAGGVMGQYASGAVSGTSVIYRWW